MKRQMRVQPGCWHVSLRHLEPHRPLLWQSARAPSPLAVAPLSSRSFFAGARLLEPQLQTTKIPEKPSQGPSQDLKEQRERDWAIIRQLLPSVWPKDDRNTKLRVVMALGLLVAGKVWVALLAWPKRSRLISISGPQCSSAILLQTDRRLLQHHP